VRRHLPQVEVRVWLFGGRGITDRKSCSIPECEILGLSWQKILRARRAPRGCLAHGSSVGTGFWAALITQSRAAQKQAKYLLNKQAPQAFPTDVMSSLKSHLLRVAPVAVGPIWGIGYF